MAANDNRFLSRAPATVNPHYIFFDYSFLIFLTLNVEGKKKATEVSKDCHFFLLSSRSRFGLQI